MNEKTKESMNEKEYQPKNANVKKNIISNWTSDYQRLNQNKPSSFRNSALIDLLFISLRDAKLRIMNPELVKLANHCCNLRHPTAGDNYAAPCPF